MSVDDLRSLTEDNEEDLVIFDEETIIEAEVGDDGALFLGMTPLERMFISMFLFMNVAILGVALLLATNRI